MRSVDCHISFWLDAVKGTARAPAVNVMSLNFLRGTKIAFFQPLKGTSTPVVSLWVRPSIEQETCIYWYLLYIHWSLLFSHIKMSTCAGKIIIGYIPSKRERVASLESEPLAIVQDSFTITISCNMYLLVHCQTVSQQEQWKILWKDR